MKIRENEFAALLLIILFSSIYFQRQGVSIPNYHSGLITTKKSLNKIGKSPIKDGQANTDIEIDTSSHLNIISKVESDFSKNWLRRYNKGIRFEFYPPN